MHEPGEEGESGHAPSAAAASLPDTLSQGTAARFPLHCPEPGFPDAALSVLAAGSCHCSSQALSFFLSIS